MTQQQPAMTPFDALGILDRAASLAPLNRTDHVAVQQAVQVIAAALREKEPAADENFPEAVQK